MFQNTNENISKLYFVFLKDKNLKYHQEANFKIKKSLLTCKKFIGIFFFFFKTNIEPKQNEIIFVYNLYKLTAQIKLYKIRSSCRNQGEPPYPLKLY